MNDYSGIDFDEKQFIVYRDKGNNPTMVKLAGLRLKTGKAVEFEVTKKTEARISENEAIKRFISMYFAGHIKKFSDGGKLILTPEGVFGLAYNSDKMTEKELEEFYTMILNPNQLKPKDKGRKVYASNKTWDFEGTKIEGILEDYNAADDQPFYVSSSGEMKSYTAIQFAPEPVLEPFDLSNEEVRAKLRGRWIRTKNGINRKEIMISRFQFDTRWVIETNITAKTLMDEYEFLDGTACGEYILRVKEN